MVSILIRLFERWLSGPCVRWGKNVELFLSKRNVLRFMLQPLYKGLRDKNAHVRKTAVMGCVSVYELDPLFVLDGQVAVNAIQALEVILKDEGGLVLNQTMVRYLLGRFKDWTAGQLLVVLGILCRYRPETDDEIYDIMNDIDAGLQHSSLAVQMATLRLFIWQTQNLNEIQDQVQQTIFETLTKQLKSPLLEVVYATLDHIKLMVQQSISFYEQEDSLIETIFCSEEDPTEIRSIKISILGEIATRASSPKLIHTIIRELFRYSTFQRKSNASSTSKFQYSVPGSQKQQHQRLSRNVSYVTDAQVSTSCHAIRVLGSIGACKATFAPSRGPATEASSSIHTTENNKHHGSDDTHSDTWKWAMEALFEAISYVSGLDIVGMASSTEGSFSPKAPAPQFRDADAERVLSAAILATEECWQARFDFQLRANALCKSGGILSALQVKAFGSILLRHLDQDELDRQTKKNKPLRTSYNDNSYSGITKGGIGLHPTMSTLSLASSSITNQEEDGDLDPYISSENTIGGLSNLARAAGIRILMMEEALAQQFLKRQILSSKKDSPERQRRQAAWDKGREMREMYATLLQQQVQEMVQLVARQCRLRRSKSGYLRRRLLADGNRPFSFSKSDSSKSGGDALTSGQSQVAKVFEETRYLQLAVLKLACSLVAMSFDANIPVRQLQIQDRDIGEGKDQLKTLASGNTCLEDIGLMESVVATLSYDAVVVKRRLSILEFLLETLLLPDSNQTEESTMYVADPVSRDVRDRARWIRQQYYIPISEAKLGQDAQGDNESPSLLTSSSSPFKVVNALVQLYGVPCQGNRVGNQDGSDRREPATEEPHVPMNLLELENKDRLVEHAFNTMAIQLL
ncbi:AP-4 complex subunit beta-1 [Actinomortierella wolfii]|nr:AP-4 complex subunit beta-1 [Actinomortierella wolfii]